MGKSTYPKRFEASLKASIATKKVVDADSKTFKSLAKVFGDGAVIAGNLPGNYLTVFNQQADVDEQYGKAVAMILEYEDQMDAAGGDKKAVADLKKKIKAEEKKCDAYIKMLNDLRLTYSQLRALAQAQIAAAQAEFAKLNSTL